MLLPARIGRNFVDHLQVVVSGERKLAGVEESFRPPPASKRMRNNFLNGSLECNFLVKESDHLDRAALARSRELLKPHPLIRRPHFRR